MNISILLKFLSFQTNFHAENIDRDFKIFEFHCRDLI